MPPTIVAVSLGQSLQQGHPRIQQEERDAEPLLASVAALQPSPALDHTSPPAEGNFANLELRDTTSHRLYPRQSNGPWLPYTYDYSGPSPGTLAGIVLGIVGGIALIILLFWAVFSQKQTVIIENDNATEYSHRSRRTRSTRRRRRHSSRTRRSELSEVREVRPASPPRRRSERIIVEETRRTVSRPPPPPEPESEPEPMPPSPRMERRVEGDDVVEVIEEESELSSQRPPSEPRRPSGYRTVDPDAYAGGNYARRSVYGSDRRRSSRR